MIILFWNYLFSKSNQQDLKLNIGILCFFEIRFVGFEFYGDLVYKCRDKPTFRNNLIRLSLTTKKDNLQREYSAVMYDITKPLHNLMIKHTQRLSSSYRYIANKESDYEASETRSQIISARRF